MISNPTLQNLYAIGDLQGCATQLQTLMENVLHSDPAARWFFVGDLVNRGPRSLDTLRMIRSLGERASCVLGNHDLHLLAVAHGIRKSSRSDTIDQILQAPDRDDLLDWLRRQSLAQLIDGHLLVHAGVPSQWTATQTLALAHEVETALRGPDWVGFLREMYGNAPERWDDALRGAERLRCIVNGLTRMRLCTSDGSMMLKAKEVDGANPAGLMPWFEVPGRRSTDVTVVFGHWSTRGLLVQPNVIGLDSGCIWGGQLTAMRLADRALFEVSCPQFQAPGE
ncbi:symmetrical bis(5'-nucleosyl)-tetraphosphatase [Actimicrobium antarcticum]|uniref:bis(5'-nucleosyl)-tetraphosphatase (symmetrical) n=1 Tax=Actimicrobium antarcticum TaxID=1051899 RepID=A0ABP7TC42_9BURK